MNQTEPIFSKWIIEGIPGFVFGSDKELYRLPFNSGPNWYGLREIKQQPGKRWKLNGIWHSERQLKKCRRIKLNPNPEVLIEPESDLLF